jgi:hypothetical protein
MVNFPLYDNIIKEINDYEIKEDLTVEEKKILLKKIKKLDQNGFNLLYVLIKVFHINNTEDNNVSSVPYEGNIVKNNIKFDFDKLPIKLKFIIDRFIQLHIKSLQ